ncbi:MAG: AI-2E family transporter [Ignavibacteriaceae bacterium]|nr:AI-2E family transporter [Ignavibacteriaceae bacterium]
MTDSAYNYVIKVFLWLAAVIILLYLVYLLTEIIIILAIAILLAFILSPFVSLLEGRGFNRLTSTLIIFGIFGFIIYFSLSIIIPKFVFQMNQLISALEGFSIAEEMKALEVTMMHYIPFLKAGDITHRVEVLVTSQLTDIFNSITTVLSSIVSVIAVLVIVPFITFFILKDYRRILQGLLQTIPNKYFEMSYHILKKVTLRLGLFVRAWIFDATFVGAMIGFGFFFIGVPNALPLGVIAGIGHLIPYFGPVIGGIPAIIVSIVQYGDFSQVPLILLVVLISYSLDNGFVQPYIFGKSADMHPIVIILLIISGGILFGLFGMLLAVPVATVIKTFAKEIYFAKKNYKIARV